MLRPRSWLAATGWLARSSRGSYALLAAAVAVSLAFISVVLAQTSRRQTDLQGSQRALVEGRYEEVAQLTAALDQTDPAVVALSARADIARGRYQEAEHALRPVALKQPTSDAALELGLLLQMLGREEATEVLSRIASRAVATRDMRELGRAARALRALGLAQEANVAYREAVAASPRDPALQTSWGELFLERQRNGEALPLFEAALSADPKWGPAMLGAARALADDDPEKAVALAKQALEVNSSDVAAYVFLAARAADADHPHEARQLLARALDVNPSSLDAHALIAGLDYVDDQLDAFENRVAKVLAIAPRYGEVYRVAGEYTARAYRFAEAAALARRGLTLDPDNPRILADLGVHLLRTGDEPEARVVLERSFKRAPYNVVTLNLLRMMDTLEKFETVKDGNIVLRMDPVEAPVLREPTLALAKQALATLGRRYQIEVKGPILIEMFPKHDDFAVRNVGLPGMIGALGACFGRVVTLDSPKARPPGDFQWEATLWHELAHVVTLQMSNQRVPRWLTEGISVYEETLARPEWGRGMEVSFAMLLNRDEALKLADLNAAFMNPQTISLAYYQASLLVEHLVAEYGDAGVHRLLRAYGEGLDTDEALRTALDTSFAELQGGYDEKLDRQFADLKSVLEAPQMDTSKLSLEELRQLAGANPRSYPVQLGLAHALRRSEETEAALDAFERARALVPNATGEDAPSAQIAEIALEQKDTKRAISALEALLAFDFDNIHAARQLASLLREAGIVTPGRIRPVYERIVALDPFDAEAQTAVGRLALERNDAPAAIRAFRTVLALRPVDRAAAHTDLAESYLKAGDRAEARKQTLAALEIAPSYERAQDLLLGLAGNRP
jgi:tetratricopeptide (TPR) repeat protein